MKKNRVKKLELHFETVRHLSVRETFHANGAMITNVLCTRIICPSAEPSFCNEPICP